MHGLKTFMRYEHRTLALAVIIAVAFMTGCASVQEDGGRDFEPTWPDEAEMAQATPGAIYVQGTDVRLWQNVTARNVGDTLTIRLQENTSAEKTASTTTSKQSSAELAGPTVFGRPVTVNGVPVLEGSMDTESNFAGNGASKQSKTAHGSP